MFAHKSLNALDYKLKFSGAILNLGFYTKLNALKFTYSLSIFFFSKKFGILLWGFLLLKIILLKNLGKYFLIIKIFLINLYNMKTSPKVEYINIIKERLITKI